MNIYIYYYYSRVYAVCMVKGAFTDKFLLIITILTFLIVVIAGTKVFIDTNFSLTSSPSNYFSQPRGLAIDSHNNVYVADANNSLIQKFSTIGYFWAKWQGRDNGTEHLYYPLALAVDKKGNMFVADYNNYARDDSCRIIKLNSSGSILWIRSDIYGVSAIAVDSQGNVYIAGTFNSPILKSGSFDSPVLKLSTDGTPIMSFGAYGTGDGKFLSPVSLALDSHDNLYVVDCESNKIQKFYPNGTLVTRWTCDSYGADGYGVQPGYITIDPDDNIYIAFYRNCRIKQYNTDGKYLGEWGSFDIYNDNEQLEHVTGIVADSRGNIFVSDMNNDSVRKFSKQGLIFQI